MTTMVITPLYRLVLETTLQNGSVLRSTLQQGLAKPFAETLAGNLNASIRAAAEGDRRKVNSNVVVVEEN